MRIAFITIMGGSPWGGSEALWSATAQAALRAGHQVFFAAFDYGTRPPQIQALLDAGAQGHFRPTYNPAITVRLARRLRTIAQGGDAEIAALRGFRPDRIVISQGSSYDLLHYPALQDYLSGAGIPYYIVCHNYNEGLVLPPDTRQRLLSLFGHAEQVFMICAMQLEVIQQQLLQRLPNSSIVNNPLNIAAPGVLPPPNAPDGAVSFAAVASMHLDRKAHDILFSAFSAEQWRHRNWRLNLYGDGPDRNFIEGLVPYFGLENRVVFHGHVGAIRDLWASNDILVLSSRIETGPMVVLEAMLCGRPVVATSVGKVPELITDGVEGFVAGAATATLLEDALERAWHDREGWEVMGQAAFSKASADADPEAAKTFLRKITEVP